MRINMRIVDKGMWIAMRCWVVPGSRSSTKPSTWHTPASNQSFWERFGNISYSTIWAIPLTYIYNIYILFRHLCDMPILRPCFHAYNREILRMGLALPILVANLQLECSLDDQRWASPIATRVLKMRQTTGLCFFKCFLLPNQNKKNNSM